MGHLYVHHGQEVGEARYYPEPGNEISYQAPRRINAETAVQPRSTPAPPAYSIVRHRDT
jgi:hypothetical protein